MRSNLTRDRASPSLWRRQEGPGETCSIEVARKALISSTSLAVRSLVTTSLCAHCVVLSTSPPQVISLTVGLEVTQGRESIYSLYGQRGNAVYSVCRQCAPCESAVNLLVMCPQPVAATSPSEITRSALGIHVGSHCGR